MPEYALQSKSQFFTSKTSPFNRNGNFWRGKTRSSIEMAFFACPFFFLLFFVVGERAWPNEEGYTLLFHLYYFIKNKFFIKSRTVLGVFLRNSARSATPSACSSAPWLAGRLSASPQIGCSTGNQLKALPSCNSAFSLFKISSDYKGQLVCTCISRQVTRHLADVKLFLIKKYPLPTRCHGTENRC